MIGRSEYHWAIDTKDGKCLVLWLTRDYNKLSFMPAPYKVENASYKYQKATPLDKRLLINMIFAVEELETIPKV